LPALVSQFGLTYHDQWPTDGRTSKAHLNAWLTALRRLLPDIGYLWLLEFQKRNAPHYHIFLTITPDEETRLKLAEAWCRITSPGDAAALCFHQDRRNWIAWDMGTGSYLCKYLDKEAQKATPQGSLLKISTVPVVWLTRRPGKYMAVYLQLLAVRSRTISWLGRLAEKQRLFTTQDQSAA
jgi:hypothetical protein